jgi:hypothetical protein
MQWLDRNVEAEQSSIGGKEWQIRFICNDLCRMKSASFSGRTKYFQIPSRAIEVGTNPLVLRNVEHLGRGVMLTVRDCAEALFISSVGKFGPKVKKYCK